MTDSNDTARAATRYMIEALRPVYLAHHERDTMTDTRAMGWIPVGEVVEPDDAPGHFYHRDAFALWIDGHGDDEPALGMYRVIRHESQFRTSNVDEFEIRERRERIIERVERPAPATYPDGTTDETTRAFDVIADAVAAPGVER